VGSPRARSTLPEWFWETQLTHTLWQDILKHDRNMQMQAWLAKGGKAGSIGNIFSQKPCYLGTVHDRNNNSDGLQGTLFLRGTTPRREDTNRMSFFQVAKRQPTPKLRPVRTLHKASLHGSSEPTLSTVQRSGAATGEKSSMRELTASTTSSKNERTPSHLAGNLPCSIAKHVKNTLEKCNSEPASNFRPHSSHNTGSRMSNGNTLPVIYLDKRPQTRTGATTMLKIK